MLKQTDYNKTQTFGPSLALADAELNGIGKVSSQRDLGTGNSSPGVAFIWNPCFLPMNLLKLPLE